MNCRDIDELKFALMRFMRNGCILNVPGFGASGKIVGIGFKPLWTNPADSKIEKLEINFKDGYGNIKSFCFYNVIGYEIVSYNGLRPDESRSIIIDFHVYSLKRGRDEKPYDKVKVEITRECPVG